MSASDHSGVTIRGLQNTIVGMVAVALGVSVSPTVAILFLCMAIYFRMEVGK